MSVDGQIVRGNELGYVGHNRYIWLACSDCGGFRWVRLTERHNVCAPCGRKRMGKTNRLDKERPSRYASEFGYNPKKDYLMYKDQCPECGSEVWRRWKYLGKICRVCANKHHSEQLKAQIGPKHPRYKGHHKRHSGYMMIKLEEGDPFISMASKRDRYVFEHRLVMARHLGRPLEPWEIIHHLGIRHLQGSVENKSDNLIDNLELHPKQASHLPSIKVQQELNRLRKEIEELKALVH